MHVLHLLVVSAQSHAEAKLLGEEYRGNIPEHISDYQSVLATLCEDDTKKIHEKDIKEVFKGRETIAKLNKYIVETG